MNQWVQNANFFFITKAKRAAPEYTYRLETMDTSSKVTPVSLVQEIFTFK